MTDRELLEAAAKAAGINVYAAGNGEDKGPVSFYTTPGALFWDPLNDDGDALRLAVTLGLQVTPEPDIDCCSAGHPYCDKWSEERGDDMLAVTRRAIVRAAADMKKD